MIDITNNKFKLPFFWTLVVLFFITSSLLILYSFGYTFNSQRGIFVHAGSITIKSNPQDIEVTMNGVNVSKKLNRLNNSFHINKIHPDDYLVEIKAPGFKAWSKKISIHSGFSTEFWNVLLTRDSYEKTAYDSNNISNFFISPSENLIATTKNENGIFSTSILDTEKNISREVFSSEEYSFTDNKEENIEWSPQSQSIILPLQKGFEKEYLSLQIENGQPFSISKASGLDEISNVRWDTKEKNIVYFTSMGNLYRMDISNPQEKKILAENISGYDISGGLVYYFQLPSGLVFQKEVDTDAEPVQATMSAPADMEDPSYKLIVYDKEKFILRNKSGKLYVFNIGEKQKYFENISNNASGTQFSNDGKKLLFWDNREIYVYYLADWETQPYRSENEIKSVTRYSQPIENIHWSNDFEHVIFSVGNEIKVVELDDRGNRNTLDITRLSKNDSKVVSNFFEDKLYFIDNKNGTEIPIIQSVEFPEKIGLLNL